MGQKTIRNLIYNSYKSYPEHKSLSILDTIDYSYKDLYYESLKLAVKLKKLGIKKDDKVAILSFSNPNWGISYLAANILGAITVPILNEFSPKEVYTILEHSEAKVLFLSARFLAKFEKATKDLEYVFDIKTQKTIDNISPKQINKFEKAQNINININLDKEFGEIQEDDISSIIYTSGTTGASKGVMLSNKNLISNLIGSYNVQNVDVNDRFLSILPLSHTYECTIGFLMPLAYGSNVIYLDAVPTPSILLPALQKVKPTLMLTVPLFIEKIYNNKILPSLTKGFTGKLYKTAIFKPILNKIAGNKLKKTFGGKIHFFGIGGALLSAEVESFLRKVKFPYAIGYGLTETAPLIAGTGPKDTKFRAAGFSVKGQELKLINIKASGEGEIVAKGDNVMKGYFKNEELTKKVFTEDGWFKTGDLGYFDSSNRLYIRGRLKNVIIGAGGENIYPETIESIVNKQKLVLESIVYELEGKLIAKIHLNYDDVEKRLENLKNTIQNYKKDANEYINEILEDIRNTVNNEVSKFSKLALVVEQAEPFKRTPTMKIKKYLYTKKNS